MTFRRRLIAAAVLLPLAVATPVLAQSGDPKTGEQAAAAAEAAKDAARKADEYAEAARLVSGPAGNAECVWLGRRVVNLLWRDDLDTAFRHIDLYDRFNCPGMHVQNAFRCLVKQGHIDPKAADTLAARIHACWLNPNSPAASAAAAAAPAATPANP
ncbi:MAG TPA: beta-1-3, beta-1-6-glucan biosynthesis protein [Xanthobacteraceae bacterium]|nr:beta-1-3, beta-1-6-glucan biosynthesis protein [Xanthobacteraceae bacterium]